MDFIYYFIFLCYICISYFFFYDNILSTGKLHVQKRASSLRQVKSQVCRKKNKRNIINRYTVCPGVVSIGLLLSLLLLSFSVTTEHL